MTQAAHIRAGLSWTFNAFRACVSCRRAAWFAVIVLGLAACSTVQTPAPPLPVTPTSPPTATPVSVRPTPPPAPSIASSGTVTLTIWAPADYAPGTARGGPVLQRQVDQFTRAHPQTAVDFALKSPYGQGGLLDFLLKVQSLVPDRLPDLVVLDSREVDAATQAGLLQPLDRDLPAGAYADLLPPAQTIADYGGQWLDLPLTLEAQQLAYNSQLVHQPPATWDELVAQGASFAFPANGDDAFLFQYFENGGRLTASQRPSALDAATTAAVLGFFQRARAANLVPDGALGLSTSQEVWQLFAAGQVPLAQVAVSDYWAGHDRMPNAAFAALPTRGGRSTTLASAWSYAIITGDPRRHAAAAQFLQWITDPARVAEWASAARLIPARRSAFALAVTPRPYADFLLSLLSDAMVEPYFAERGPYAAAWRAALQAVLRGQATPNEAALKAAQAGLP